MEKLRIALAIIFIASFASAGPNVDIMFIIKKINTRVWQYNICENNPHYIHPYYSACIYNQQPVGFYVDRTKIRTIPYATINPPNPFLENHTFWLNVGGGGSNHCIDDFEEGPVLLNPNNGLVYPCLVVKDFNLNLNGLNTIYAYVRTQCESCSLTPGIGYGMEGMNIKNFYGIDLPFFQECSLPCHPSMINNMTIDLYSLYPCDPAKVYGCQPGEYN